MPGRKAIPPDGVLSGRRDCYISMCRLAATTCGAGGRCHRRHPTAAQASPHSEANHLAISALRTGRQNGPYYHAKPTVLQVRTACIGGPNGPFANGGQTAVAATAAKAGGRQRSYMAKLFVPPAANLASTATARRKDCPAATRSPRAGGAADGAQPRLAPWPASLALCGWPNGMRKPGAGRLSLKSCFSCRALSMPLNFL